MIVLCRICGTMEAVEGTTACSAAKCQEAFSQAQHQAAWYEVELQECQADLYELESGRYVRTYRKLLRVEALVKVMELGLHSLKSRFKNRSDREVHVEIAEWQAAESESDRDITHNVMKALRKLRRKLRSLERKVRVIDQDWETLAIKREMLQGKRDQALMVLGE